MELKEIVLRDDKEVFQQEEMEYVVEQYIKERKGVDIKIRTTPFDIMERFGKLIYAFNYAVQFYKENRYADEGGKTGSS